MTQLHDEVLVTSIYLDVQYVCLCVGGIHSKVFTFVAV